MIFDANKAELKTEKKNILFFVAVDDEEEGCCWKKLRSETKRMSEEKGIYG